MAAECLACAHPERERIDAALIAGSIRQAWDDVAKDLDAFSLAALARHARNHARPRSLAGRAATDSDAVDLVASIVQGVSRLERIAAEAEARGDRNVSIRASAEARAGTLALLDRLGIHAEEVNAWINLDFDFFHALVRAIEAAPAPAVAWADALDAIGGHEFFSNDLRKTATAHL